MEEAKQTTTAKKRKRALVERSEEPKPRERRQTAEIALEPHDQQLIEALQAHLASQYGERRQRARILRASCHHGLLLEIVLAGPDKSGLYAGRYTGKELAEMTRQQALLLSDFQARYSTPLFQAVPAWPPTLPVLPSGEVANGSVPSSGSDTEIDKSGAAALKGLGTGLMKRKSPALPLPD